MYKTMFCLANHLVYSLADYKITDLAERTTLARILISKEGVQQSISEGHESCLFPIGGEIHH